MRLCIVGYPLGHTLSPVVYNRYFRSLGISARYGTVEISPERFETVIGRILREYDGFNVTIPFKERILDHVEVQNEARIIRAVNCVFRNQGYNTDWIGFVKSLEDVDVSEPILVLGAGGAARAVLYGLCKMGMKHVILVNRTFNRAARLAESFRKLGLPLEVYDLSKLRQLLPRVKSLINTTSVGLKGDIFSIEPHDLSHLHLVYDVVYGETPLQQRAKGVGVVHVIGGEEMLRLQAVENLRIWGLLEDEEVFKRVFEEVTR
ncbi:MAG: shikimate dehydrogenase [Thermotogae bacterium]|nr:shikimate dehydrogenase [Thermotogota bacterium]RKX43576.1 MAG: shikimate dehydrogenase [Thermotogota bacterium]